MDDDQWTSLVQSLVSGTCVLVLGPDVPAISLDSRSETGSVREAFCKYLAGKIEEKGSKVHEHILFAVAQQFEDNQRLPKLINIAAQYLREVPFRFQPGFVHLELAKFPFNFIITTCHDDVFF